MSPLFSQVTHHVGRGLLLRLCIMLSSLLGSSAVIAEVERWGVNMTQGVTPMSHDIYDLHMTIFIICVVIGVVVFGVMFYSMLMHRKSRGVTPSNFHESLPLELAWTIVPFIILIVMAWPATKTLIDIYDHEDAEVDILITGYQWKWKYEYMGQELSYFSNLSTPQDEIYNRTEKNDHYLLEVDEPLVLPVGKKVRFLITAADVIHAWWVPDLAVKKDAIPGFINESWAFIEKPGIYRGQCAELCGKDHGFMPIVVKAVPEAEYNQWLQEKRALALKQKQLAKQVFSFDELMAQGEVVYASRCAACHGANGEGISGTFPALQNSSVAVGPISKHTEVVLHGVDGTAMQAFSEQLTEVEAAAVITYERNAWGNNMGDLVQPIDVLKAKSAN